MFLLFFVLNSSQARLNEIITSGAKIAQDNESPEFPWMIDGVGLPSNASELLPKLVMTYNLQMSQCIFA